MGESVTLQRISAQAKVEDIVQVIEADGGVIVEGLFPVTVIERLRQDITQAAKEFAPGGATQGTGDPGNAFVGANTIRFSSLGKVSGAFFDLLENEIYAKLSDHFLLPHCGSYWVNTGQAMLIGPDSPAQPLHRDCFNWPAMAAANWPDGPELTLSAMIALDEVTEELGATRVIPGSHRWADLADCGNDGQTVPAEMSPGDALVYSGKLVHGDGANQTSDRWRLAMHLSFVLGWLTPEESSALDYTDAELSHQSERVRRVLGHSSYDPRPHFGGGLWLRDAKEF